ncbi:MAG: FAD:protein FMN transferase [Bryobacteraceae bacterium]
MLLLLVAPAMLLAAEPVRVERSLDSMGSTYTVVAYGENKFRLLAAVDEAFEEVRRLDHLLSNYRPGSEWSQVNRYAAERPVQVSEELYRLLSDCIEYSRASGGTFDITVGPLMKVWGFYKGSGRFPHRAEIRGALARVGYRNIVLDPVARTVAFRKAGVEMDPGGIGKGYAVDRMVEVLRSNGVESALISAGSSSIYALGSPPEEKGWRISIRHPKDERKTVQDFYLKNESISTSGNYEKFFFARGKMYSHIMDPRTGYPADGVVSVSVVAPKTIDSEAWTKPFFILGREWTAQNKPKGFRVFLCEDRSEPACALLQ